MNSNAFVLKNLNFEFRFVFEYQFVISFVTMKHKP